MRTFPVRARSAGWPGWLVFVAAAIVIVPVFAGLKSLAMLAVGLAAVAMSTASAYLFLARRGLLRWVSLAVFVLTPVAVIVVYAFYSLLWVAAVSAAAWLLAGATARLALRGDRADWRMPEHPGGTARRAPVPDHESEIRRRQGGAVRACSRRPRISAPRCS